jgi:hypothetical protein
VEELESLSIALCEIEATLMSKPAGQTDNRTLEKTATIYQERLKKTLVTLQEADVEMINLSTRGCLKKDEVSVQAGRCAEGVGDRKRQGGVDAGHDARESALPA